MFQAGLSWRTILHKREAFRKAFSRFDPRQVARFDERDVARLMNDAAIVRNRMKIEATVENARRFLQAVERHGSFQRYLDEMGGARPVKTTLQAGLRRDFKFMGPLVAEAYLQSVGMIAAPHEPTCFMTRRRTPPRS